MSKAVNLFVVAAFTSSVAVAGIMMPVSADQTTSAKTVVSRESWTGSYTVDGKSYDNMTYVAMVYDDGSVEIKGQHTYNWTSYRDTFDLGTIWYDDSLYKEIDNAFTEKSSFLTLITNYNSKQIGYSFSMYNGTTYLTSGTLFDFTITPKSDSTNGAVIDAFGHKITVNADAVIPTEDKDAKISELEAQVATLQEELSAAKSAAPAGTGDVDGNGSVNAKDAAYILQYAAYVGTGGTLDLNTWMKHNQQETDQTNTTQNTDSVEETQNPTEDDVPGDEPQNLPHDDGQAPPLQTDRVILVP